MILELGKFIVDIDLEKTKLWYQNAFTITEGCQCDGCCNYEKAIKYFPDKVKEFFDNQLVWRV